MYLSIAFSSFALYSTYIFTTLNSYKIVFIPKIQMEGKWLEAEDFSVGDKVHVDYDSGKIVIRTDKETFNA